MGQFGPLHKLIDVESPNSPFTRLASQRTSSVNITCEHVGTIDPQAPELLSQNQDPHVICVHIKVGEALLEILMVPTAPGSWFSFLSCLLIDMWDCHLPFLRFRKNLPFSGFSSISRLTSRPCFSVCFVFCVLVTIYPFPLPKAVNFLSGFFHLFGWNTFSNSFLRSGAWRQIF